MLVTSLVTKKKRLAAKKRPHTVSRRTASLQLDVQPVVQPAVQQSVQPAVKSIGQSFQLPGASPPQHKKRWAGAATDHNSLVLFRRFCLFEIFFVERRSGKAGVGSRSETAARICRCGKPRARCTQRRSGTGCARTCPTFAQGGRGSSVIRPPPHTAPSPVSLLAASKRPPSSHVVPEARSCRVRQLPQA